MPKRRNRISNNRQENHGSISVLSAYSEMNGCEHQVGVTSVEMLYQTEHSGQMLDTSISIHPVALLKPSETIYVKLLCQLKTHL